MGLVKRWFKDAGLPERLLPTRSGGGITDLLSQRACRRGNSWRSAANGTEN